MKLRALLVALALPVLLLVAACGGSSSNKTLANAGQIAKNSPAASVAANASPTPAPSEVGEFGVPPVLGGNVTAIMPKWAETVTQAATRTPNKGDPHGVCADISYAAPATNALWFRMAVDGEEVTQKLTLLQHVTGPTATTAETGTICYAPAEGLPAGDHSAAVSVQEPNNLNANPIQTVAWKFKVSP